MVCIYLWDPLLERDITLKFNPSVWVLSKGDVKLIRYMSVLFLCSWITNTVAILADKLHLWSDYWVLVIWWHEWWVCFDWSVYPWDVKNLDSNWYTCHISIRWAKLAFTSFMYSPQFMISSQFMIDDSGGRFWKLLVHGFDIAWGYTFACFNHYMVW